MSLIRIRLFVTPIYTFTGKKFLYSLSDMAYGEWIVFKNNYPRFYINAFEFKSDDQVNKSVEGHLERCLKNKHPKLTLKQHLFGFKSRNLQLQWIELEQISFDELNLI